MTPLPAQGARADRTLERLYRRHAADVYRYALAVLHNSADAEDVTQTTFLNAYRALEGGERPRAAHNWLIAIAHNVCRQRFRQSARRPSEVAWDDDVAERLVDDDVPSGDDIRRALSHLGFNQRAALVMRELEGRSYAEIAEVLELSVGAVETLIFRARRALREQLEEGITCGDAELAISKQLDGRLPRAERPALRAHLRECAECATFARRQRAQRTALRSLGAVPLPASLASLFGGGAGVGAAVAAKAAAVVAAAALVGGAGYESVHHVHRRPAAPRPHPVAVQLLERPRTVAQQPLASPQAPASRAEPGRPAAAHALRRLRRHRAHGARPKRTHAAPFESEAVVHGGGRSAHERAATPSAWAHAGGQGRGATGSDQVSGRAEAQSSQSAPPPHPAHPPHPGGNENAHAQAAAPPQDPAPAQGRGNGRDHAHQGIAQPSPAATAPPVAPPVQTVPEQPLQTHGKSGK